MKFEIAISVSPVLIALLLAALGVRFAMSRHPHPRARPRDLTPRRSNLVSARQRIAEG